MMWDLLPKIIRIGYADWVVEKWDPKLAQASGRLGECDLYNHIIRIDVDHQDFEVMNILIHEIFHAIYNVGVLKRDDEEERIVTVFGNQFTQVLRDNPRLAELLSQIDVVA